ncbi:uncharacterized protein MONBRDRAFT_27581 [Monosiga brevicollis MX1]|uniref:Dynamin N-terminal domain-containing protein n=1 Tax=Monosiga brevicollis TaxID=81824 RepID=A9V5P9_MONBE|nr:uncharacterized protein MONBRDRAFT_27581 [Monosiga brevicollis MX1]EDQ87080.1 predicted protein [Monosiga brevicollis MX1]|eukprot:XP_001748023.1 hypothetical protein [Monosiga brevicollis MX1]
MQKLQALYNTDHTGLCAIGQRLGLKIHAPQSKVTVLLVGNHSAGKSSFINWYIQENLQKTGVAMETNTVTLVTHGQKRETLGGEATIQAFPYFKDLAERAGLVGSLTTQISTSRERAFPLVTFIDTPGLVDGDLKYTFDIETAITLLGAKAELTCVFFDPLGQALCKRTLDIVERLQIAASGQQGKVRYYLSKADTAGTDKDRFKVITQTTQNLCRRPALNSVAFEMPVIYIPDEEDPLANRVPNQIYELCGAIDETVQHVVQNSLNGFKHDCQHLLEKIDEKLEWSLRRKSRWFRDLVTGFLCLSAALGMLFMSLYSILYPPEDGYQGAMLSPGQRVYAAVYYATVNVFAISGSSFGTYGGIYLFALVVVALAIVGIGKLSRLGPTLTKAEVKALHHDKEVVQRTLENNFERLYRLYLGESVGDGAQATAKPSSF